MQISVCHRGVYYGVTTRTALMWVADKKKLHQIGIKYILKKTHIDLQGFPITRFTTLLFTNERKLKICTKNMESCLSYFANFRRKISQFNFSIFNSI